MNLLLVWKKFHEKLIHVTKSGYVVRSKSEAIIADTLFAHNIPFRYECELNLGDMTLYPDFTIMNPLSGDIVYWEHFGMMNVENAIRSFFGESVVSEIIMIE